MTRRVVRANANQVSLFPFLAVLVCTMGALLVLLVVMAHQARVRAADVPSPDDPPPAPAPTSSVSAEDVVKAKDEVAGRLAKMSELLKKTKQGLDNRNLELAHLEEDLRRWHDKLVEFKREYHRLKSIGDTNDEQLRIMRDDIKRLKDQISEAAQLLAEEQKRLMSNPKSFALIPYDGTRGTYRRPLYVECTKEKVILQPLGIALTEADFDGPLGPENPLAAALRAMRQHLTKNAPSTGQPQAEPYPFLVVRPDGVDAYQKSRTAIRSWGSDFGYEFVEKDLNLDWGQPDPEMAEAVLAAIEQAKVQLRMLMKAAPKRFRGGRLPGGSADGGGSGSHGTGGGDRFGSGPSGGGGTSQSGAAGSGGPLNTGTGSGAARGDGSQSPSSPFDPAAGQANVQDGSARPDQVREGARGGVAGGTAGGDALEGGTMRSVAATRGRDWALPQKRRGSIGYSRPISVQIQADRIVFPNLQGQSSSVELGPRTSDSIDQVVSVVWKQMESWGSAGNDAHWKPVLKCDVAPDARSRFKALTILLMDSGVDVGIKQQ